MVDIGIIKGKGSGDELTFYFKKFIDAIVHHIYNKKVNYIESLNTYSTFWSSKNKNFREISDSVSQELFAIEKDIEYLLENNVKYCFRTGINAETLYYLRQKYKVIKEILIINQQNKILIIRDEIQGFYANTSAKYSSDKINFSGEFTSENINYLLNFSFEKANKFLTKDYKILAIYKYHLFGNIFEKWFKQFKQKKIELYQPDTGIIKLLNFVNNNKNNKDLLLIVSNEVGDIIYEFLINLLKIGNKNELFTNNIYTKKEKFLCISQTVHGSADNIANLDIINPISTLRIAAHIVSKLFKNENITNSLELSISKLKRENILTQDLGGIYKTSEIVDLLTTNLLYFYEQE